MKTPIETARQRGDRATTSAIAAIQANLNQGLRKSIGLPQDPPPPCMDEELAYFSPDSIVRSIHVDLPSMVIGGFASLLLQMLHPLAMAGVAQHSAYREDPLGRMERTAFFIGITSFGSRSDAEGAIARVRAVHNRVHGVSADGRPYSANDPDLITWVHAAEVSSFLAGAECYGTQPLSDADKDSYLLAMSRIAYSLGATQVPTNRQELADYFVAIQPELEFTKEARQARNFVLRGVRRLPHEVAAHVTLVSAAQALLPKWAQRQLHLPRIEFIDRISVEPVARKFSEALRWMSMPPQA
jgi:uncharacterized protein (DUF2236 family)